MERFRSMREVFDDPTVRAVLRKLLFQTEALKDWAWLGNYEPKPIPVHDERRWSRLFTLKEVAKAAGVRVSLLRKYAEEGVRGSGRLIVNEEGKVDLYALKYFASQHSGRARDIALRALERLEAEPSRSRSKQKVA